MERLRLPAWGEIHGVGEGAQLEEAAKGPLGQEVRDGEWGESGF